MIRPPGHEEREQTLCSPALSSLFFCLLKQGPDTTHPRGRSWPGQGPTLCRSPNMTPWYREAKQDVAGLCWSNPFSWGASTWPQITAQSSTLRDHRQHVQPPREEQRQQRGFRKVETRSTGCREYVLISHQPLLPSPSGVKAPPANTVRFPSWRAARTFCLPVMWTFQFVILTSWAYMKLFPEMSCLHSPSVPLAPTISASSNPGAHLLISQQ